MREVVSLHMRWLASGGRIRRQVLHAIQFPIIYSKKSLIICQPFVNHFCVGQSFQETRLCLHGSVERKGALNTLGWCARDGCLLRMGARSTDVVVRKKFIPAYGNVRERLAPADVHVREGAVPADGVGRKGLAPAHSTSP